MRKIALSIFALANLALLAVPAYASDGSVVQAGFTGWVIGAAVLAFFLGSIPPNRGEAAGWEWDMKGALMWAVVAASLVAGIGNYMSTGALTPALYEIAVGVGVALLRIATTRPARTPKGADLTDGVNRVQGDSLRAKSKAAQRAYNNASFHNGKGYYASRGREWNFGDGGVRPDFLEMLGSSMQRPSHDTFDILVLLVRELPGQVGEPGVVVVRGGANLRACKVAADGITLPDGTTKIAASTISASVGYAWR